MSVRGWMENELGSYDNFPPTAESPSIKSLIIAALEKREQMSLTDVAAFVATGWNDGEEKPTTEEVESVLRTQLQAIVSENQNGTFTLLDTEALR
jgi:hypothetical protein